MTPSGDERRDEMANEVGCAIDRLAELESEGGLRCLDGGQLKAILARLEWCAVRMDRGIELEAERTSFNRQAVSVEVRRRLAALSGDRWGNQPGEFWGTFFAHLDDKTLCGLARHLRELFALLMIYFK